jgi:biopolymer transport protein ExbB
MSIQEIFSIIASGGWVMIMLAILGLLLYSNAIDLLLYLCRGNLNPRSEKYWGDWVMRPEIASGRAGEIIRYTQRGPHNAKSVQRRFDEVRFNMLSRIDRRLLFVNTLVATAPLAGLLGTVIGMLRTFDGIATGGRGDTMSKVAGGIHEALLTTQTGLMIALPGVFFALVITRKRHALEAAIARIESLTLTTRLDDISDHEHDEVDGHDEVGAAEPAVAGPFGYEPHGATLTPATA